jgi:hypothetical protein
MITVAELIGQCGSTHAHHNCLSGSFPPPFEAIDFPSRSFQADN